LTTSLKTGSKAKEARGLFSAAFDDPSFGMMEPPCADYADARYFDDMSLF
jgi:hypothetical protein